jgi:hypothetical protein
VQGEIRAKVAVRPDGTGSVEVEGPVMLQGSVKSVLERAQLDPACGGRIFTLFVTFEISKIVPEGQTLLKETLWVAPNRLIIRSEAPDLKPQP